MIPIISPIYSPLGILRGQVNVGIDEIEPKTRQTDNPTNHKKLLPNIIKAALELFLQYE